MLDKNTYLPQSAILPGLITQANLTDQERVGISAQGADFVRQIRAADDPGLMEVFLAEYGLSTDEGIALMCLAEALLRVPDATTIDALIEDKIAPSDWEKHLGRSSSSLVNASTWALLVTGKVLEDREPGIVGSLRGALKRLGEPVIRTAVARAMREMGSQFVLGQDIQDAMKRGSKMEEKGFTYSYDMLGEAALTDADARRYQMAYANAISEIAENCTSQDTRENPGISVKLSALFPRYEVAKRDRVMRELVPRVTTLARLAKEAQMGFNIDAEEADRLSLSFEVIEAVLADEALAGWDGFGVVVQAYGLRAARALDLLHDMAEKYDRKIMVRLVKGAYWDTEIKRAQVLGLEDFPLFTSKSATDVSYIANARKLFELRDRIYPQFATHNAHTAAAVLHLAQTTGATPREYEFQRLHGMGEALHTIVMAENKTHCRIYAPVGAHRDLLAYLVRRLLENGANSSFVNQIVDDAVPPEVVATCPFDHLSVPAPAIPTGPNLFGGRLNSKGYDLTHAPHLEMIDAARAPFETNHFTAAPLMAKKPTGGDVITVKNPATGEEIGQITWASDADCANALTAAKPWDVDGETRAKVLNKAADLYEDNFGLFYALLAREAGKSMMDAMNELREAIDFMRYYAGRIDGLTSPARGIFTCISPWNFPLAIFSGQIAGALAAGNGVLAKPAEQTGLVAYEAVKLLHQAGVPKEVLQLLPGDGATVGAALTSDARVNGVAFTGGTDTAMIIRRAMAEHLDPGAPFIAETGGMNAMIVDSTALPEQAVRDITASSFQSAGQRCSALRCLYVQEDVAEAVTEMLIGATKEMSMGTPWHLPTDIGPVIDDEAMGGIRAHIDIARTEGRVVYEGNAPTTGHFVAPTIIKINAITDLEREIFGPVLHLITFKADELDKVIDDVNATGYGLTFGLHTRIDARVQHVAERVTAGNIYVNRNQIGAVVGSQPFGGEGLSGTGPKAGGPMYVQRFCQPVAASSAPSELTEQLPGPTGELNRLSMHLRPALLCLGPDTQKAQAQAKTIQDLGGQAIVAPNLSADEVTQYGPIGGVVWEGDAEHARSYVKALAARTGAIVPLITGPITLNDIWHERHLCVDLTASGGNAELLQLSSEQAQAS